MTTIECASWLANKLVNPTTGRKIKPNGPTYRALEKKCASGGAAAAPKAARGAVGGSSMLLTPPPSSPCDKWLKNPSVNPRTNRSISATGKVYSDLKKECSGNVRPTTTAAAATSFGQGVDKSPSNERERGHGGKPSKPVPKPKLPIPVPGVQATKPRTKPSTKPLPVLSSSVSNSRTPWLDTRLERNVEINRELKKIDANQWDMCMSGVNSKFKESLGDPELIGRGSFGDVYIADVGGARKLHVVIKEAYLTATEKSLMMKNVGRHVKYGEIPKNSYPVEYLFLQMINDLLTTRRCPNFIYTYNIAACAGCRINQQATGTCYVTFMEPASTDLESYRADELHVETQYNMIQQLLLAVYAIESVYGIYHRDIKLANVLIKRIQPGGYFAYVINSKPYYIKNSGIFLCLADFGVATSFMPIRETTKLTNNRYGSRNAEIMTDKTTGELYYKPITCNYNAYRDKKGKGIRSKATPRIWFDERTNSRIVGTTNQFVKGVDIKPNTPVVLTDTVRFPPFEFFNDIQDVLRMFASGKRMLQPGNHPGFVHLDDQLRAKINSCVKNVFPYEIYGAVKYVRADAMLDEFYTPIPKPTDVVDTYIM